jgi:hypothetical protein
MTTEIDSLFCSDDNLSCFLISAGGASETADLFDIYAKLGLPRNEWQEKLIWANEKQTKKFLILCRNNHIWQNVNALIEIPLNLLAIREEQAKEANFIFYSGRVDSNYSIIYY